ncbi:hypothetical protein N9Z98_01110 [Akkermansiaceae bacterium]|nr:hypothetical protein [Akkermansiaceae bacterium]MDC0305593.1 hypothetical protein [Akkermansiaceae bacterium]
MSTTPLSSLSDPLNGAPPQAPHPKRKFLVVSQWRTVYITELDKRKQITLGWVSSTD